MEYIIEKILGRSPSEFIRVNKFGYNPNIGTATAPEDIWDGGGLWVPPTTARIHSIVSDDANDTSAGSGGRTLRIVGQNSAGVEISEDITLNGLTPVNTTNSYTVIYRMYLLTAGSSGVNAGNITATAATDSTITAQITAGRAQTLMAIYVVPSGYTAVLYDYYASITRPGTTGGVMAEISLRSSANFGTANQPLRTRHLIGVSAEGQSTTVKEFNPPMVLDENTLLKLTCESTTDNSTIIYGGFDLVLVR